nr:hypothetical protein DBT45_10620 [Aerococcus tenax]
MARRPKSDAASRRENTARLTNCIAIRNNCRRPTHRILDAAELAINARSRFLVHIERDRSSVRIVIKENNSSRA